MKILSIGFLQILTLLFITLKLTHNIDWSWWWVLAPLLWPIYVLLAIAFFCLAAAWWETYH